MCLAQPLSRPTACQLQEVWGSEVAACPALPIPTFLGAKRGREPTRRGSTGGTPHLTGRPSASQCRFHSPVGSCLGRAESSTYPHPGRTDQGSPRVRGQWQRPGK